MVLAILKASIEKNDIIVNTVPFVVGRCRTANLIIPRINISRSHCEIVYEGSVWKVKDRSSSGTYVNGSLVGKEHEKILQAGDFVRLGSEESNLLWIFLPLNQEVSSKKHDEFIFKKTSNLIHDIYASIETNKRDSSVEKNKKRDLDIETRGNIGSNNVQQISKKKKEERQFLTIEKSEGKEEKALKSELENFCKLESSQKVVLSSTKNDSVELKFKASNTCNSINSSISCSNSLSNTPIDNPNTSSAIQCDSLLKCNEEYNKKSVNEQNEEKTGFKNLECKSCSKVSNASNKAPNVNKENEVCSSTSKVLENFTELIESELQCIICSELFVNPITLGCSHSFCLFCLKQWKVKQKTCPVCRKKISTESRSLVLENYIEKVVEQLSSEIKKRREDVIQARKIAKLPVVNSKRQRRKTSAFA